jgi:hypothetical protein
LKPFQPQENAGNAKIPSARTSPRFEMTRHVAALQIGNGEKLKFLLCPLRFFAAILPWSRDDTLFFYRLAKSGNRKIRSRQETSVLQKKIFCVAILNTSVSTWRISIPLKKV